MGLPGGLPDFARGQRAKREAGGGGWLSGRNLGIGLRYDGLPLRIARVAAQKPISWVGQAREKAGAENRVEAGLIGDEGAQTVRLQFVSFGKAKGSDLGADFLGAFDGAVTGPEALAKRPPMIAALVASWRVSARWPSM